MSYLLGSRLNKIEQQHKAKHPQQVHFLRESDWLQHQDQIEALKGDEYLMIEVRERRVKRDEDDELIVLKKRIQADDMIFIDDIFDADEVDE